ncbi:hypothetical protein, partial [Yersinia pseudotuberculosis]|uniref:hypothetical protein n=1 Tax=Yersinia pseudotuberculosis TaxID=633 RepID=UPI001EE77BC0
SRSRYRGLSAICRRLFRRFFISPRIPIKALSTRSPPSKYPYLIGIILTVNTDGTTKSAAQI